MLQNFYTTTELTTTICKQVLVFIRSQDRVCIHLQRVMSCDRVFFYIFNNFTFSNSINKFNCERKSIWQLTWRRGREGEVRVYNVCNFWTLATASQVLRSFIKFVFVFFFPFIFFKEKEKERKMKNKIILSFDRSNSLTGFNRFYFTIVIILLCILIIDLSSRYATLASY